MTATLSTTTFQNSFKTYINFAYRVTLSLGKQTIFDINHYLAQLGRSCTKTGHFASWVTNKNSESAGVPAECSDGVTTVLPGHTDPLWTTPPFQLQLPHHHKTLTGAETNIVNNTGKTSQHKETQKDRGTR